MYIHLVSSKWISLHAYDIYKDYSVRVSTDSDTHTYVSNNWA